jgi:predicted MFS family arabinose efflux permease
VHVREQNGTAEVAGGPHLTSMRRARIACSFYFLLTGIVLAVWTARIPSVKERLALHDSQLTIPILAVAVGSVVAMRISGRLVDRFGSATVCTPAGLLLALSLIAPGFAPSLPVLACAVVFLGLGHGLLDVSMNTHAIELERLYGRPILSSFHAVFSVGALSGAGLGALAASQNLSASVTFLMVSLPLTALALAAGAWLIRPAHKPSEPASAQLGAEEAAMGGKAVAVAPNGAVDGARSGGSREPSRRSSGVVLFLGVLGLCCLFGEGAVTSWSSTYMHDTLGSSMGMAPLAYAAFSITMATGRFLGDQLALRLGPVLLVRLCGTLAAAGLGMALLIGQPFAALAGFAVFGFGLSCIVPQVFTAAGNRDPEHSGRDLAQVSSIGYLGLLVCPVVMGPLAEVFSLSIAFGLPVLLAVFVALCAGALRPTAVADRDPAAIIGSGLAS